MLLVFHQYARVRRDLGLVDRVLETTLAVKLISRANPMEGASKS